MTLDDCELYYEVEGSGPGLVFAHGLGGNHMSWWQQVPYFRDRYTCVTFAHRGFAPSTGSPDPTRFPDDLTQLIDHLGLREVRLVGQSMGGWAVLGFALREPARARAIVMSSTIGALKIDAELERMLNDRTALDALMATGIHPAAGVRMAREQPVLHHLYQLIDRLSVGLDKMALRPLLYRARTVPPEAVASSSVPILWIFGDEDTVPRPVQEWVTLRFPRTQVRRILAAGHSTYFERADIWNRVVDEFFATVGT